MRVLVRIILVFVGVITGFVLSLAGIFLIGTFCWGLGDNVTPAFPQCNWFSDSETGLWTWVGVLIITIGGGALGYLIPDILKRNKNFCQNCGNELPKHGSELCELCSASSATP